MISEKKPEDRFPVRQIHIGGFDTPIRLDHNKNSEDILVKLLFHQLKVSMSRRIYIKTASLLGRNKSDGGIMLFVREDIPVKLFS